MSFREERWMTRAQTVSMLTERWRPPRRTEMIPLEDAAGRICAWDVRSRNTLPVGRSAEADGIAVRAADFQIELPDTAAWLEGRDYAMVNTGNDFDDTFDTVILIEEVSFDEGGRLKLALEGPVREGQEVAPRGSTLDEGELLAEAGLALRPQHLCLLAAGGHRSVEVLSRPVVAYIPTGNELVPAGEAPSRGENVESNGVMVAAFLRRWGAQPLALPVVRDRVEELEIAFDRAFAEADIILVNGGSSKGSKDHCFRLLERRAECMQHGVGCIPGIPIAAAMVGGKPAVNLPGPPFAAFCAMDWCVRPLVCFALGRAVPRRERVEGVLLNAIKKTVGPELYVRVEATRDKDGGWRLRPFSWEDRFAVAWARFNALMILPGESAGCAAGQIVEAELLEE